jgi:hypothetical protein
MGAMLARPSVVKSSPSDDVVISGYTKLLAAMKK